MQKLITVYKPPGLTPLEVIKQIKLQKPELANLPITYAGRLDPLAQGILLLLVGDETKNRDAYLILPKTYTFEVVFGIETDTYDVLGYVKKMHKQNILNVNLFVNKFVINHIGKQLQSYPPYSSKPVQGKPLFWWAKHKRMHEIEIPKKEIEIFAFTCKAINEITVQSLKQHVEKAITSVHGDFRQKEIENRWNFIFSKYSSVTKTLPTATFSLNCSSGTYVRNLVHQMGRELGCGAIALTITRTAVGNYEIKNAEKLQI